MESIEFNAVVPQVFAERTVWDSELWNRQCTFSKGHSYLLLADSGRGKSSFCAYVTGMRKDYHGNILFDGANSSRFTMHDWVCLRRTHISYLYQELRLFPELTAWENVEIKNRLTGWKSLEVVTEWFERLGIADKRHEPVSHLSFGQQQRVAMMRALVQPFDFLLADEPISHLDDEHGEQMAHLMIEEATRQGAGFIVTSIGRHWPLHYDKVIKI